jgi:hypothetical protein
MGSVLGRWLFIFTVSLVYIFVFRWVGVPTYVIACMALATSALNTIMGRMDDD